MLGKICMYPEGGHCFEGLLKVDWMVGGKVGQNGRDIMI